MTHAMSDDDRLEPQLATLERTPPPGDQWIHEIKYDGYRTIAEIKKHRAHLYTRSGFDWTDKYPSIARALEKAKLANVVLDGEVVWVDDEGKTDFQKLQNALKAGKAQHLEYFVFDILFYEDRDLREEPLIKRKAVLEKLFRQINDPAIRLSEHWSENSKDLLNASCRLGLEGIISKKVDAPYEPGRNHNWVKSKCTKAQEFIIAGYLESEARYGFRSLLLGTFLPSGELQYTGRVGTGFTQASMADLAQRFKPLIQEESPFDLNSPRLRNVVWLKPKLVAQINFTEWTSEGSLRHPSFQGLREDKRSKEVHPEGRSKRTRLARRRS